MISDCLGMREAVENAARRHAALAEKFEVELAAQGYARSNPQISTACLTLSELTPHLRMGACEKAQAPPTELKIFGFPGRYETDY